MRRGVVIGLTAEQKLARARYLAGHLSLSALDDHVRRDAPTLAAMTGYALNLDGANLPIGVGVARFAELDTSAIWCPSLYYQLEYPNGGTDPTAPDPAARVPHPNVTARLVDCTGGGMWCQGADRFAVGLEIKGYTDHVGRARGSWLNCDSLIIASQTRELDQWIIALNGPELGCVITCATGSPGHERCGHQGTVIAMPERWDPDDPACWDQLLISECGGPPGPTRSNRATTGNRGWRQGRAHFIRVALPQSDGVEV